MTAPHTIFYGPTGAGKTAAAEAYAERAFGGRSYHIDAALEGGIDVFRDKVFHLCRLRQALTLCIVDNADMLTLPCQQALRRVMETQSHLIRFAFCMLDEPGALSYALHSRCQLVVLPV